ncbi:MAG TPA: DUF2721 domain-containing protein [Opitutaceae bacterium]|nr:DUF2721 domain-containing protein [Opitutaceae bacterium]
MDDSLLSIIQLAITPVILISGMGALMLTLTNRMGRIVDRTRSLAGHVQTAAGRDEPGEREHLERQLEILWRRALLIRRAVTFNGMSMLVSCLLVVAIFADAMRDWNLEVVLMCLFAASMLLLIASLVTFLRDIFVSLHALRLEVDRARAASRRAKG